MRLMWGLLLVLMVSSAMVIAEEKRGKQLYRYKGSEGQTVLNDTIPPKFAHKGYSILNAKGRVIEVVPRSLTEEELVAQGASLEEARQRAELASLQKQRDQQLLILFSDVADAERARDSKLEAMDVMLSINNSNIMRLQKEHDQVQEQAAGNERQGKKVPERQLDEMGRLERQIAQLEEGNRVKEQEKVAVRELYLADIERLKILTQAPPTLE